jgi:hypothetical protein
VDVTASKEGASVVDIKIWLLQIITRPAEFVIV